MHFVYLGLLGLFLFSSCATVDKAIVTKGDVNASESLTNKMLSAVNDSAWQNTGVVEWTFLGGRHHLWDRERSLAKVSWKKYEAYVEIGSKNGVAFKKGIQLEGEEATTVLEEAWHKWANDSYWLNPITKIRDEGVTRAIGVAKNGREGLLVTYNTGGVTPGDSYFWEVNKDGLPTRWRLWVQILPLKGAGTTWQKWVELSTGAQISTVHRVAFLKVKIKNLRGAYKLEELYPDQDPFGVMFRD